MRANSYTSSSDNNLEKSYINNFMNENKNQIEDFYLNIIIEKIAMKFSINNVMIMLDLLKNKLISSKRSNDINEYNNSIYIMKRLLFLLSERVIEPGEILNIHNCLMEWLMSNFKELSNILGYSINLALIINSTLTNLYGENDLKNIEDFFVNFLANETNQDNEEVDFISYWIIEKILKKNKNINELITNIFSILNSLI